MDLDAKQVISQIIAFLLMLWILKKLAWKPLLSILEQREKEIKDKLDSIDDDKREINELKGRYEQMLKDIDVEAKARFQRAANEGRHLAQEIQQKARQQSQELLTQAQREIQREVAHAKVQLKNDVVNLALAASNKVLKSEVDNEKNKALVNDFLSGAELK